MKTEFTHRLTNRGLWFVEGGNLPNNTPDVFFESEAEAIEFKKHAEIEYRAYLLPVRKGQIIIRRRDRRSALFTESVPELNARQITWQDFRKECYGWLCWHERNSAAHDRALTRTADRLTDSQYDRKSSNVQRGRNESNERRTVYNLFTRVDCAIKKARNYSRLGLLEKSLKIAEKLMCDYSHYASC